jgi:hypothetical protein
MTPTDSHSVTDLLVQLRSQDTREYQEAARRIWGRYLADLLTLARRHLSPGVRRREDEQDVLQSMYKSFCIRQRRGEYELTDRKDLWRLLVAITENKARAAAVGQGRQKRDYRRELPEDGLLNGESGASPLDRLPSIEPTPAEAALLVEELRGRLEPMEEPLRRVALWKLAGYTNEEIAGKDMLDCAVRTVERKLKIIRQLWERTPATGASRENRS